MAEEKQSPIGIIVVVAVIAVVVGIFLFKGGGNGDQAAGNQQQPTNGSDTNQTTPQPEPPKPGKPTEPEEPAFVKEGLVTYYPFNGNAKDESGYGNHGVVKGATLTNDRHGNTNRAYHFDNSSIVAPQESFIPYETFTPNEPTNYRRYNTKSFSTSFWFKAHGPATQAWEPINKGGSTIINFSHPEDRFDTFFTVPPL